MPGLKVLSLVLEITFFLASLYVLIALGINFTRYKRRNLNAANAISARRRQRVRDVFCILLGAYCLVSMGKASLGFAFFRISSGTDVTANTCASLATAHQFMHTAGVTLMFVYLWIRQNVLYRNKFMSRVVSKTMIRFSGCLIILIVGVGAVALVLPIFTVNSGEFDATNGSCMYKAKLDTVPNDYLVYLSYTLVFLLHGAILFLFLYILRRHRREFKKSDRSAQNQWAALKRLRHLMRSCLAASVISASGALVTVVADTLLWTRIDLMSSNIFWDVDMMIDLACLIICFTDWRQMLSPWLQSSRNNGSRRVVISSLSLRS